MKLHLDLYRFALFTYFPERNTFLVCKLLHTPCGLEATGYEVHGNKKTDLKSLDELSATMGIAVANAPVNGEHHHIEAVGNLADVLQFAKILLFMGYRVYFFIALGFAASLCEELLAIDGLTWHCFRQKSRIPVIQVPGMEDSFTLSLNNPRHTAVCTA